MPNGLIFDVDGVLADTEPISVRTLNQAFNDLHGVILTNDDSLEYMGATAQRHVGGLVQKYELDADVEELIALHESLFINELAQTRDIAISKSTDLLHEIAGDKDWCVGLATSSTRTRSQKTMLACNVDVSVLTAWLTGDDITKPKPDPEIYIACALAMGISPSRCTVIEDSVAGVTAAKAAGMNCIALTGTFPGEALRGADRIVDSLSVVNKTMLYDMLHESQEAD